MSTLRKITRREALAALAATGVSAGLASRRVDAAPLGMPIGLQLYTVSEGLDTALESTLRTIAAIGYREIELPPVFTSKVDPRLLRRAREDWPFIKQVLQQAGLRCRSVHVLAHGTGSDRPSLDQNLSEQIEFAQYIGAGYIVCTSPPVPARFRESSQRGFAEQLTLDDWKESADYLNKVGGAIAKAGLKLAYHNHHLEFRRFGDTVVWDALMKATDPNTVKVQLDVGHLTSAGFDPAEYLRKYPRRVDLMHVRDISARGAVFNDPTKSTEIGSGIIDWPSVFRAAQAAGLVQYYVEQDRHTRPSLEAIRISYGYLNSLKV